MNLFSILSFFIDTHHYHVTITFQSWVSRSNISLYSTDKTAVSQMMLCACEISIQTRFWRHIGKKVVLAHKSSSYERIKNKQVTLVESKCAKTIYINSIRIIYMNLCKPFDRRIVGFTHYTCCYLV